MEKVCSLRIGYTDEKEDLVYILKRNGYIVVENYLVSDTTNVPIGWDIGIFKSTK